MVARLILLVSSKTMRMYLCGGEERAVGWVGEGGFVVVGRGDVGNDE